MEHVCSSPRRVPGSLLGVPRRVPGSLLTKDELDAIRREAAAEQVADIRRGSINLKRQPNLGISVNRKAEQLEPAHIEVSASTPNEWQAEAEDEPEAECLICGGGEEAGPACGEGHVVCKACLCAMRRRCYKRMRVSHSTVWAHPMPIAP